MTYAQKVYPQQLGNGKFTIAEAGCMLTMFANGLEVINDSGPDPVTLNEFFLEHNIYIKDADGALEDLAWGSISHYDPTIVVSSVGTTAVPPSNLAGVEFRYNSVQSGVLIDHFCWVDHIENGQIYIIDSWDGLVKSPAEYEPTYHSPIAYATYIKNVPAQAPTAPPTPPTGALTIGNSEDTYTVVIAIPGYIHASDAANHVNSNSTVQPSKYYVFNRDGSMINVTRVVGKAGWWINPTDNVVPTPTVTIVPAPTTTVAAATTITGGTPTVTVTQLPAAVTNPNQWKETYAPFNADRTPEYFELNPASGVTNLVVSDLSGQSKDLPLKLHELVPLIGVFTGPDNLEYGRTANSVTSGKFYGFPMEYMIHETALPTYDTTTTPVERIALNTKTTRDYLLKAFYDISKFLDKLSLSNIKK